MKLLKNEVTFLNMIKYSSCKIVKMKKYLTFSPAPIPNAMLQWRPENVALDSFSKFEIVGIQNQTFSLL